MDRKQQQKTKDNPGEQRAKAPPNLIRKPVQLPPMRRVKQ